ncbi:MAG: glycosyltransferase family 2 protein [Syntrophales bacterium]|nr:glycosyltransferase family 2 protein [Syntrophales bacterium]
MINEKKSTEIDIKRVAVVIPVFNHEGTVAEVVRSASRLGMPLFVVDDGSTDGTYEKIKDMPGVTVIRHDRNRGKGAAILTGFAAASVLADWAVTIDADGQHYPEDAQNLLQAVPAGKRPIVVGKREGMEHQHVPWSSRFGRKFSNFWVRASGGPSIEDTQSGFRLYPLPEAMCLRAKARRFQFEVEILAKARWRGMPVFETPVRVTYQPEGKRISHYRGFVDFCRNSFTFSRLILMRICVPPFMRR